MNKLTGKLLNKLWNVGAKHALYREDGKWYHSLIYFPGALFDKTGYIVFETEENFKNNQYLKISNNQVHINNGISNMPGYIEIID
jgi:5-methylcytosine-specific restriction protein A